MCVRIQRLTRANVVASLAVFIQYCKSSVMYLDPHIEMILLHAS